MGVSSYFEKISIGNDLQVKGNSLLESVFTFYFRNVPKKILIVFQRLNLNTID